MNITYNFSGKTIVVTGAASGLGRGAALKFAKFGANIVVCDVNENGGTQTVKSVEELGAKAIFCKVDVTNQDDIVAMRKQALKAFKTIDVLVNIAGVGPRDGNYGPPLTNISFEDWERLFAINTIGTIKMCTLLRDIFAEKKEGKIINIASLAAYMPSPLQPHYSASKAAVVSFTHSLSMEMGPYNVNVNCVNPGFIYTPGFEGTGLFYKKFLAPKFDDCETAEDVVNKIAKVSSAMGRAQTAEDIADTIIFLASDGAREITGQVINVDSGVIRR